MSLAEKKGNRLRVGLRNQEINGTLRKEKKKKKATCNRQEIDTMGEK